MRYYGRLQILPEECGGEKVSLNANKFFIENQDITLFSIQLNVLVIELNSVVIELNSAVIQLHGLVIELNGRVM